jgi:hypothetical protein
MIIKATVKAKKIEDKVVSFLDLIGVLVEFFEMRWGKIWIDQKKILYYNHGLAWSS